MPLSSGPVFAVSCSLPSLCTSATLLLGNRLHYTITTWGALNRCLVTLRKIIIFFGNVGLQVWVRMHVVGCGQHDLPLFYEIDHRGNIQQVDILVEILVVKVTRLMNFSLLRVKLLFHHSSYLLWRELFLGLFGQILFLNYALDRLLLRLLHLSLFTHSLLLTFFLCPLSCLPNFFMLSIEQVENLRINFLLNLSIVLWIQIVMSKQFTLSRSNSFLFI